MTAADAETPDPRTEAPGICGISYTSGAIEWVCIAAVHDTEHQRSRKTGRTGYHPKSERHYMVNRYPWRARPDDPWPEAAAAQAAINARGTTHIPTTDPPF